MATVTAQMEAILNEYVEGADDIARHCAKEAADHTARTLRSTSPRRFGGYARGWSVKSTAGGVLSGYVVHNKKYASLTHLLEHGHVVKNQYGAYDRRVGARVHIAPAEQQGMQEFEALLRERL